jgi:hypothetical protein
VQACLELIAKNGDRAHHVIDGIRAMFQKDRQEKGFLDVNQIIRDTLQLVRGEENGSFCTASCPTICDPYSAIAFSYSR